jgi:hypothetical protein
MRLNKACHRAARKSLDGHLRFVVIVGRCAHVCQLRDLRNVRGDIQAAYSAGHYVPAH